MTVLGLSVAGRVVHINVHPVILTTVEPCADEEYPKGAQSFDENSWDGARE